MNKFKIYFIIICATLALGCSKDSNSNPNDAETLSKNSQINYTVNGVKYTFGSDGYCCFKSENTFIINPSTTSSSIEFSFDTVARFGYFKIDLNTGTSTMTSKFYSSNGFSSHYFDFNISSIDEVHKRVKGNFSGYLYSNPLNINSEQKYVSGDFDIYYYDIVPYVSGLKNTCKINGSEWIKTNEYSIRGIGELNSNIIKHYTSDDEYKIMINYKQNSINVGTYNFSDIDTTNKVQLAKFDIITGQYVIYNCTGTLNIVKKEITTNTGSGEFILKGDYNLTAINPNNNNEIIQVSDGNFKLQYEYFP